MGYDALPREYRMKRSRMLAFLWVIAAGTLSVLVTVLTADGLPAAVTYCFLIAWVALMGWLFHATLRCSTTADLKALQARGMIRRRRLAWEDIQDIRAEPNPAAAMQRGASEVLVHAYGRDGSKVLLPFVDDLHVSVQHEVRALREIWEELRGDDWTPDARAAVLIHRRNARQGAMMTGFGAAMVSFIPLTVLMLLPLFTDLPGWLESTLSPAVVMGAGLPLIFAATAVVSYRGRVRGG